MFVKVFWGRLRPGKWEEYEKLYNEHISRVSEGLTGFKGRQLLRSTENPDEGVSITMWDTLEDLREYDQSDERQRAAGAAEHLYTGEYWQRNFEVTASSI